MKLIYLNTWILQKKNNNTELLNKCFDYIKKETGVEIKKTNNVLNIEFTNPQTDFIKTHKYISNLSNFFYPIKINLTKNIKLNTSQLENYIKNFGNWIYKLNSDNFDKSID